MASNPMLNRAFNEGAVRGEGLMTFNGFLNKTFFLLLLVIVPGGLVWNQFYLTGNLSNISGWMIGGAIAGLILAIVTAFFKRIAFITAPFYAIAQGLFLGGISAFFELMYPGIVMQAVMLTGTILLMMLFLYRTGIIKPTAKFMMGVAAATGAVGLVYLASFVLGFFSINIPYIHGNGWIGIGFSAVVIVIAALNLIVDFALVEEGVRNGAPKYIEWYAAFALMVTLIWLYLEILRLMSKLRSR
ncbi:MAG: hypothetical protein FMNOHCHN_00585 [Ignavibacteriaceae bacterium]|nr:hypothetical protein [Ignavibacteriaceae bacterium]